MLLGWLSTFDSIQRKAFRGSGAEDPKVLEPLAPGRMQFCDTADCKSALRLKAAAGKDVEGKHFNAFMRFCCPA